MDYNVKLFVAVMILLLVFVIVNYLYGVKCPYCNSRELKFVTFDVNDEHSVFYCKRCHKNIYISS